MNHEHHAITDTDYQLLAELRHQIRRFMSFSEQAARDAGMEPQQHQYLLAVKGLPPGASPTIGEIAERLMIQHHSTVELTNRLEERGLVERHRGEADRRQVFIHLTALGETLLHELSRHHLEELRSIGPDLVRSLNGLLGERISHDETVRGSRDTRSAPAPKTTKATDTDIEGTTR